MRRIGALATLAVAIWLLSAYGQSRPRPLDLRAPATQFSAARADAVLGRLLNPQRPHPAGSAESAVVRGRVLKELADMGISARTQTSMSCYRTKRRTSILCGTVTNIIATALPGSGKQILLVAHSDSVRAGPGAGDDTSGVATILESVRVLKARNLADGHPVAVLISDGEELGFLGATAYLRDPDVRANTSAVINVESRGNQGPSYLFQTGPGDARLIDLYAGAVSHFAASSLYAEIYKYLPNDTDMTPFLAAGVTGYNFAFIGNGAQYHTALDRRENIAPATLQQHGENVVGVAQALRHADLDNLKSGNAIYLDVLGYWLPRLAMGWSLPLSVLVFILIALTGLLRRSEEGAVRRPVLAVLMPPLLLVGCIGMGFVLHGLAAWISGHADPSFAHPVYLRLSLGFGAFAVALLVSRGAGPIACWLWLAGLSIVCAIWAPGAVPYFLFPSLVAAPLLLISVRGFTLFVAALAGLIVWLSFNQGSEALMGLRLHPLFMVTAAFGLITMLPLLRRAEHWRGAFALSLLLALTLSVIAGLQPAYSSKAPEWLNLGYVEAKGKAWWLAEPVARLPQSLRNAANFSATPQRMLEYGYVAPAGTARNPVPAALVSRTGDIVSLDLKTRGDGVALLVPQEAQLQAVTIGGITTPASGQSMFILCGTPDCATARMTLKLGSAKPLDLTLLSYRGGLPPEGARLLQARPPEAVPYQAGDRTILAGKIAIPAR